MKKRISRLIDRIIDGTHDHFLCHLPKKIGFFSQGLLRLFYRGIKFEEDAEKTLRLCGKKGRIAYVIHHKSRFDFLFFHMFFSKNDLPVPEIGIGYRVWLWQPFLKVIRCMVAHIDWFYKNRRLNCPFESGFIERHMENGGAILFHLVEKSGFLRRLSRKKDPVKLLVEHQKKAEYPVFCVPLLIFFDRAPSKSIPSLIDLVFGPKENPGGLRKIYMLFTRPDRIFVEMSSPLDVSEILEQCHGSTGEAAEGLRNTLLNTIRRHRQSVTGPTMKSHEELKELILSDESTRLFIERFAEENDLTAAQVYKKADGYIDEIAAKYNIGLIRIAEVLVRWITNAMFDGISMDPESLERIRRISRKGPLVLIPSHKSHIDYLILSYMLFINRMPCPLVAAGKNLSFWPLGPFFRRGGAFFLRRSFKGKPLYAMIFSQYIKTILSEGYNIEFFIEGGRSRTGKMILPKLGLLSMIIDAYKKEACDELIFVPVYIGYDKIIEESAYTHEIEGGRKKPENLSGVIKASKFLRKRYGRIYLNFHEPIELSSLLAEQGINLDKLPTESYHAFCRNLGFRVINAINQVAVVTPHGLTAAAILNGPLSPFTFDQVKRRVSTLLNHLARLKAQLSDTLVNESESAIQSTFEDYAGRKIIEKQSLHSEIISGAESFRVPDTKRPVLEYYKNNSIAFFIPAAFTAMGILLMDAFQFSKNGLDRTYLFFQDLFKNEFAFDMETPSEHFIESSLLSFVDDAAIVPHPGLPETYNITSAGLRKLKLFANYLAPYLESYWITLNYLMDEKKHDIEGRKRTKRIRAVGEKMFKNHEIRRYEALSEINFKNAVKYFTGKKVDIFANPDRIPYYAERIRKALVMLAD